jgi:hypothetical protein
MRGEECLSTPNGSDESRQPGLASRWQNIVRRRSFLHGVAGVAAGAALPATKLFADNNRLTKGDAALRGLRPLPNLSRLTYGSSTTNWEAQ